MNNCAHRPRGDARNSTTSVSRSVAASALGFRGHHLRRASGRGALGYVPMASDFLPSDFVNCTGLRFCLGGAARCAGCRTPMRKSMQEPRLRGRWNSTFHAQGGPGSGCVDQRRAETPKYSNFDAGDSWKIGSTGRSSIRCAGTLSSDFRAELNDLFSRPAFSTGFRIGSPVAATRAAARHSR
jgi:hypothetical protein